MLELPFIKLVNYLAVSNSSVSNTCPTGTTATVGSNSYSTTLPNTCATGGKLQIILQVTFGILAVVAVIIIVIGGIQILTSQGNPEQVNKARNTVIYAVIGLVVVLSAEAIVTFVLGKISGL